MRFHKMNSDVIPVDHNRPLVRYFAFTVLPFVIVTILLCSFAKAAQPTTEPALWAEMRDLNAKVAKVSSITADFQQQKFTPMLKKPLTSTGTVIGEGSTALWQTQKPQPSSMLVNPKEIRIYYPQQKLVEIYPVQGQLGALATSPLPRLEVLQQFFNFERDSAAALDASSTDAQCLAVKLTPSNEELSRHVRQVRVLLDRKTGSILRAETTDADGDRTLMIFSNLKLDPKLPDNAVKMDLPADTREAHPLEGLQDGQR